MSASKKVEPTPATGWQPRHIELSHRILVRAGAREALELFTPQGERRWVPEWDFTAFHPPDGTAVRGGVFTTREADGAETIWMVSDYDPGALHARYARITPGRRAVQVTIDCEPVDRTTSRVTVGYELTSLSPAGDRDLETWTEDWYTAYIDDWAQRLHGYLESIAAPTGRKPRA